MTRNQAVARLGAARDRYVALREKLAENHVPELLIGVLSIGTIGMGAFIGLDPNVTSSRSLGVTFALFPPAVWGWLLTIFGVVCGISGIFRRRAAQLPAWIIAALYGLITATTILSVPGGGLGLAVWLFLTLSGVGSVTAIAATGRRGRAS